MVGDNDLGREGFVSISAADLDDDRQEQAASVQVSSQARAAIGAVVEAHPDWQQLTVDDHAMRVRSELTMTMGAQSAPSLQVVQVVLQQVRAGRPL